MIEAMMLSIPYFGCLILSEINSATANPEDPYSWNRKMRAADIYQNLSSVILAVQVVFTIWQVMK